MTPEEAAAIREAMADTVRVIADAADVLAAIASAATLLIEALERVEQSAIAISSLIDGG